MTGRRVIPLRWPAVVAVAVVGVVGLVAFTWPFFVTGDFARDHGNDAPWLFAVLLGLLAVVCLAEVTAGRLDAKTIAVLGVRGRGGRRPAPAQRRHRRARADVLRRHRRGPRARSRASASSPARSPSRPVPC